MKIQYTGWFFPVSLFNREFGAMQKFLRCTIEKVIAGSGYEPNRFLFFSK